MASGLVVSSRASERRRLADILRGLGIAARTAADLGEAREVVRTEHPDVVLVDCDHSGVGDGLRLASLALKRNPSVEILLVESASAAGEETASPKSGVSRRVGPLGTPQVRTWVQEHLEGSGPKGTAMAGRGPSTKPRHPASLLKADGLWVGIFLSLLSRRRKRRKS